MSPISSEEKKRRNKLFLSAFVLARASFHSSDRKVVPHSSGFECAPTSLWAASVTSTSTREVRAIEIRWEESDLIYLETHPLSITVPSSSSRGTTSESGLPSKPDPDNGLSKGAVAGVTIAALVGVMLIAGAAFLLWQRRKHVSTGGPEPVGGPAMQGPPAAQASLAQGPQMLGQVQIPQQPHNPTWGGGQPMYPTAAQPVYGPHISTGTMSTSQFSQGQKHASQISDLSTGAGPLYFPQQMVVAPQDQISAPQSNTEPNITPQTASSQIATGAHALPTVSGGSQSPNSSSPQDAAAGLSGQKSGVSPMEVSGTESVAAPVELSSVPHPRVNQHIPDYVSHG